MKSKNVFRLTLATAGAVTLSACVSLGAADPPPFLLSLTANESPAAGSQRNGIIGESIVVQLPMTPRKLAALRVPVQVSNSRISYLKDAVWVDKPNRLFQKLLIETLSAKSGKLILNEVDAGGKAGLRIAGELINFGLDGDRNTAVVTYDAVKLRTGQPAEKKRFEAKVPISQALPGPVGSGLNEAANIVALEVATWVGGS